MIGAGDYVRNRQLYQDVSTTLIATSSTDDTTLITARNASYTIFVQRIIVWISTDAAQSWSFEDNGATPRQIAEIPASPGDSSRWDFDFGPEGVPLQEGKDLVLNVSGTGLAGNIRVEAFSKLTSVIAHNSGAANQ